MKYIVVFTITASLIFLPHSVLARVRAPYYEYNGGQLLTIGEAYKQSFLDAGFTLKEQRGGVISLAQTFEFKLLVGSTALVAEAQFHLHTANPLGKCSPCTVNPIVWAKKSGVFSEESDRKLYAAYGLAQASIEASLRNRGVTSKLVSFSCPPEVTC